MAGKAKSLPLEIDGGRIDLAMGCVKNSVCGPLGGPGPRQETLRRRNFASRPLGSVQFLLRLGFEQICDVFSLISGNAGLDLEKQVMGSNLP